MPNALNHLDDVRQLIFDGKYVEAEALVEKEILSPRVAPEEHTYQMLGNLRIDRPEVSEVTDYKRALDIRTAIATTEFIKDGVHYIQESFVSFPDDAIVIKYSASEDAKISFVASIDRTDDTRIQTSNNQIVFSEHVNKGDGTAFHSGVDFELKGGNANVSDGAIVIRNADEVLIRISAANNR